MKIRGKLLLMVMPLLIFSVIMTVYYSMLLRGIADDSEALYYDQLYKAGSTLINADRDFYQAYLALMQNEAFSAGGTSDKKYIDTYNENIQQTLDRVGEVDEIVEKYPALEEYKMDGKTICDECKVFEENMTTLASLYDINTRKGDLAKYEECFNAARDNISFMEDLLEQYAGDSEQGLHTMVKMSIMVTSAACGIIIVLVAILAAYHIIKIRRKLVNLTDEINVMAAKDLKQPIRVFKGKDEISQLSRAAFSLREQLLNMMRAFSNSSHSLQKSSSVMSSSTKESATSVRAIEAAAGDLANTATQQASDATTMSAEIQDVNNITKESIDNTAELESACRDIEKVTESGMQIVKELTSITDQSQEAFDNIFEAISGIDENARTISTASDMISDIASQTNLLSLNASIEAARAGEAGKGFAVVANEIRQLAEQSAASVETINSMIVALMKSSEETGRQSELVKEYVTAQRKSVDDTRKGFEEIVSNVHTVNEGVGRLRDINDNLGGRVSEITNLIESLAAASEENAATSEELSATTTNVSESIIYLEETEDTVTKLSDDLNSIVAEYQIEE